MKMVLLAKETAGAILSDAGITILIGLVVVFAVLLLLVFIIKAFGTIMSRLENIEEATAARAAAAPATVAAPAPVAAVAVGNTAPVSTKPEIQNGIPDEMVAVISGAIACMAPAGKQYAVRSIMKK